MDVVDQMRTLIAVADHGSFTKAGKALGKSKALVSKHIGELEDRLGARLLNRTTRQVGITEVGDAYLQRAREIVTEIEALEDSVTSNAADPRGRLKLTAPQAFGELELMELMCAFQERHPHIVPDVFLSDRVIDVVGEGFDVAIRVTAMPDSSLIVRKLCDVRICLCAAPQYLEQNGHPQSLADLAEHICIADTNMEPPDVWRLSDGEDKTINLKLKAALRINSAVAVRQATRAGLGIAACPEFAVARDIASGDLIELFPGAANPGLALHLLYPHRLHLSAKVRAFIDFAANWYKDRPPWQRA